PKLWACVAERRISSLSESYECSLSEGEAAERGSSLFLARNLKFVCLISLGIAIAR
ncbi:hypothetical protein A2U01_0112490, partial [Trifolium medium]|nr:hypothetical protein [Trifolium medium]